MKPEQERDRYIEALYGASWQRSARCLIDWSLPLLGWHATHRMYVRWHELYDLRLGIRSKHHDH